LSSGSTALIACTQTCLSKPGEWHNEIDRAPLKLIGGVRIPVGSQQNGLKNDTASCSALVDARESFTCGVTISIAACAAFIAKVAVRLVGGCALRPLVTLQRV